MGRLVVVVSAGLSLSALFALMALRRSAVDVTAVSEPLKRTA
jgi:hypothetical protein